MALIGLHQAKSMVSLASIFLLGKYWCYEKVDHMEMFSSVSRVQIHTISLKLRTKIWVKSDKGDHILSHQSIKGQSCNVSCFGSDISSRSSYQGRNKFHLHITNASSR
eukprot:1973170-Ditylum_brightwellii.AAC.1